MTKKESIIKNANNKLIAEFLGFKLVEVKGKVNFNGIYWRGDDYKMPMFDKIEANLPDQLYFDKSWDWLMPVVNKIQTEGFRFNVWSNEEHLHCQFIDMGIPGKIIVENKVYSYKNQIDVYYKTVLDFIKWYNKK